MVSSVLTTLDLRRCHAIAFVPTVTKPPDRLPLAQEIVQIGPCRRICRFTINSKQSQALTRRSLFWKICIGAKSILQREASRSFVT
jgi:hypothetical protein